MFDPVVAKSLPSQQQYIDSYWSHQSDHKDHAPMLNKDINTEVLVIGSGYTGLACAHYLAKHHHIEATLIDAGPVGWGCSSRNGGFVLNGTGRLSLSQIEKKFGQSSADVVYREYRQGIENVKALIAEGHIDCDEHYGGYLKLAHNANAQDALQSQLNYLQQRYGDESRWVENDEVQQRFINTDLTYGAQYVPYCFALNPLKLAHNYASLLAQAGIQRYQQTPATAITTHSDQHVVNTPKGTIKAKQLVIATNGYSVNKLHPAIDRRHFPVLSSILVTAPLSPEQLRLGGFAKGLMAMDTRELKYYYRLLPDNRLLFGGRGAIKGKDAQHPYYKQHLINGLYQTMPALSGINIEHFWSGWISVSLDDYPRIFSHTDKAPVHYAMGYCGSGVSFTTQAGKRLADAVAGKMVFDIPHVTSQLPVIPFASLKRIGLWGFYHLAQIKDRWG